MNNFVAFQNNSLFQYETKQNMYALKTKGAHERYFLNALWLYINMLGTSASSLFNLKQHLHMED
jgi:hypothetical protein